MNYWKLIYACAALAALAIIVCGIAYPLATTLISAVAFPRQANGSPVYYNGTVVGSELIGQGFGGPEYFHPRPSAVDYNASASGASNLGPGNPALIAAVRERIANGSTTADAALSSGSGLDPDISVDNAMAQAPRVAAAGGLNEEAVKDVIRAHMRGRLLIWGEPRVNVLELNIAVLEMKRGKV